MGNLTIKQKIIIGVIIGIMATIIGIYGYGMLRQEDNWEESVAGLGENLEGEITNQENGYDNSSIDPENSKDITKTNSSQQENSVSLTTENYANGYENLEGKIVIHITGAVKKTGILVLPEGARIADAIDVAGGNKESADLDEVNLAYVLQDGQKVYIPSKEDKAKLESKAYITSGSGDNVIVQNVNEKGGNGKVNINTATQSELENLPGIGASIASRIIEYREQNGKFSKIEDLQNVKGIGDAKFNNMKEYVIAQ